MAFGSGRLTTKPTTTRSTASTRNPIARGNSAGGWGDAQRLANVIVPAIGQSVNPATGRPYAVNSASLGAFDRAYLGSTSSANRGGGLPTVPGYSGSGGGGRGYGGGGGGGGGAVAAPTMTQGMFDWINQLIGSGAPQQITPTTLDLPDFQGTFDPTMYNQLDTQLDTAGAQSRTAADEAYNALGNYLQTNYSNAFTNGNTNYATAGQAPGMTTTDMAQLAQGQGVDPTAVTAQQTQGAAAADQGFANLWRVLAANEDTAQRNRLTRVQTDRGTTSRGIDAALLGGHTGIGMGRSRAQAEFQQRAAEMNAQIAQQEAMANWTAQQEAQRFNAQNTNDFRNQNISAMLGLLPNIIEAGGAINLPGQRPTFHTTPQDPLGWASIAAAQEWDRAHGGG